MDRNRIFSISAVSCIFLPNGFDRLLYGALLLDIIRASWESFRKHRGEWILAVTVFVEIFIQGVFDDTVDPSRFNRFGRCFDAQMNTDALIAALPQWYRCGLRAFTVGFQGGGPCFTVPNDQIVNNPFSPDGLHMDETYLSRMAKLLNAADQLGMAVIVPSAPALSRAIVRASSKVSA